jgi:hypothetical protein
MGTRMPHPSATFDSSARCGAISIDLFAASALLTGRLVLRRCLRSLLLLLHWLVGRLRLRQRERRREDGCCCKVEKFSHWECSARKRGCLR